jgi:hypothetical protein
MLPSKADPGTYYPADLAPEKPAPYKVTKALRKFFDHWHDALRPLKDRFVPEELRRGPAWDDFFGACAMCDPPQKQLLEFAGFGRLHPSVFWPVIDCDDDEIDIDALHSMVAPPIERVLVEASMREDSSVMKSSTRASVMNTTHTAHSDQATHAAAR